MKLTESPKAEKHAHLDRLLAKGTVMIFIDSRRPDVIVPPAHKENVQLMLNLDYAYEIPDFKVAEDHIEASLSFNQQNFFCVLPLDAIYAFSSKVDEEIVVFPEDVPQSGEGGMLAPLMATSKLAPAPGLALVDETTKSLPEPNPASNQSPPEASPAPETSPEKPKRGHLRLIK